MSTTKVQVIVIGAVVVRIPDLGKRVELLAVKIPKHKCTLVFHAMNEGQVSWVVGASPVTISGTVNPPSDNHDADWLIKTDWVNLGQPKNQKAWPVITLPPGRVTCRQPYPGAGEWQVGSESDRTICCEASIELDASSLAVSRGGGNTKQVDLDHPTILIQNLPITSTHDCQEEIYEFAHFSLYAGISDVDPNKVKIPRRKRASRGGHADLATVGSVCPPIRH